VCTTRYHGLILLKNNSYTKLYASFVIIRGQFKDIEVWEPWRSTKVLVVQSNSVVTSRKIFV